MPIHLEDIGSNKKEMILNLGPQHPATHGTLHSILELDGETIVKCTPVIGYLHSGFEKLGENRIYNQFVTISDRMNYMSPLNNNFGYASTIEEMLGIEVPLRGQYLRMILSECSRMSDHILCVGLMAMDIGAFSVFLWTFKERERLYDLFEMVTGQRLHTGYARIGGFFADPGQNFYDALPPVLKTIEKVLKETEYMLDRNKIWLDRTKGIGLLSAEDAISYGVTGPMLRASGVPYDIRKVRGYWQYDNVEFEVPILPEGDVFARYKVRMLEMRQSLRIIQQCLEQMPKSGPYTLEDYKLALPPKQEVYNDMEQLIQHFELVMPHRSIAPPPGEYYSATECPNGELGFFITSDGTGKPYRLKVRSPSLNNYQAWPSMIEGHMIADILAVLSSLNVIAGELDR
jgi:NADH-quinone oxidoreductase subunit D